MNLGGKKVTKLGKINNSLYLIVPKEKIDILGWSKGDDVDFSLNGKRELILRRYKSE